MKVIFFILFSFCFISPAYAYIDLSAGSFILQMLVASLMGATIMLKLYFKKIKEKVKSEVSKAKRFQFSLLHPFLVALIPMLYIVAHNLTNAPTIEILLACFISVMLSGLLYLLFSKILKSVEKAALLTSLTCVFFFTFGPAFEITYITAINQKLFYGLLLVFMIACVMGLYRFCSKTSTMIEASNASLSVFSIAMLLMIGFSLTQQSAFVSTIDDAPSILSGLFQAKTPTDSTSLFGAPLTENVAKLKNTPDIYYIILDAYPRSDVLQKLFNHDNTYFLDALKAKGFYVPPKTTTNYPMTHLSLASSLSMEQINKIAAIDGVRITEPYYERIRRPKVVKLLKDRGYVYYTFSSDWGPTRTASIYSDKHFETFICTISKYHTKLLSMTPLSMWVGYEEAKLRLYTLEKIKEVPDIKEARPKFVFVHLVMPHLPAYFDSQGNIVNTMQPDNDKPEYIEQLKFLNKKVIEVMNALLEKSAKPPIIIFQGDHGSETTFKGFEHGVPSLAQIEERFSILNAYYGPPELLNSLYETITPVNSFRKVLNYLEVGQWEPVPDNNYFQWIHDESGILDVTKQVQELNS